MQSIDEVLLIDDDQISNFLTTSLLKRIGVAKNISICLDGREAMDLLQNRKETSTPFPELVLLDINMPDMDGFEFLKAFRVLSACPNQPVIAILTTSQNYQDVEMLKNFPEIEVFLNKPLYEEDVHFLLSEYFTR
ncbi:response regulator [Adhaeribacter aerolatus]|uniref:Response regulator n=1 Tax=Adhaeribacter aerolatus TaxID=670289 RepID=A0A512ASL8_9BACT|nr:response regulator [Adhaeribacter aerolatus]GEO02702.1 response regulator [Adhaeribacter aerolatus]